MRSRWLRRAMWSLLLGLAVAGAIWFAWPRPIPVDLATVLRGPMEVSVEDEGRTRVRHVYTVSAPIAGKVLRTPRHVGDKVTADESVVAVMLPTPPAFLDVRSREELQAALVAAEAAVTLADHEVHRIEAALEFARGELRRAEELARRDVIAARALDKARFEVEANIAALGSAKAQLEVRRSERATVAARLLDPSERVASPESGWRIELRAPVDGRVLKIHQESEAAVHAGAALIEIGDPSDIEVVADLLSSDAVRIETGATVRIDGWGGPPIRGKVSRIDPAGFTKVSALGIEEQRVRTVINLVDPQETWSRLGHEFRVVAHVTTWSAKNVLTVPVSALFRKGDTWAVFAIRNGRTHATAVQIGQRNNRVAAIISGLSEGNEVVLHPSDRVVDGGSVTARVSR
jgi:HlyD family secretion protein